MAKNKKTLFRRIYDKVKNTTPAALTDTSGSMKLKVLIIFATLLICTFFFTFDLDEEDGDNQIIAAQPGDKWSEQTVVAQFSFPIYKDDAELKKEISTAKENTPLVFTHNKSSVRLVKAKLDTFVNSVVYLGNDASKYLREKFNSKSVEYITKLDLDARAEEVRSLSAKLNEFYSRIYRGFIIDTNLLFIKHNLISVYIPPNQEVLLKKEELMDRRKFTEYVREELLPTLASRERDLAFEILMRDFAPNLEYSDVFTKEAVDHAVMNVAETDGFVRKGEIIISKGEVVSKNASLKIESYNKFRYRSNTNQITFWMIVGNFGHALVIFSILLVYLVIIRKRILADNFQVAVLCAVLILVAFMAWLTMQVQTTLPIEYFVFLPGLSMLVAIVFDSRTAFYVTVTMSLLLAGVRGNDYDTGTAMMISGILAAYSVRDIQGRTQLFRSILFILIGFSVTITAFSLERSLEFVPALTKLFVAGLNSAISPLFTFALLFVIEKTTNITTDLKLEEYNNVNHPLLVKLSEMAPGSYQHTLSMSIMAEKCADSIEANKLLAKVGAYFHDIGKLARPEYFAENQIDIDNKHDMISPRKSTEAIKTHVVEGIRLAKEYKLPQRIADFIPMHHGTSLIKHFYAKAVEELGEENVDERDFRYPGPKPNSKETAIVMICDSAEAISRLSGKSKEQIEKIIDSTIQSRFLDGQFDESNITLKDLQVIKDTCVKHLYGASHQRVEYKEIPKKNG